MNLGTDSLTKDDVPLWQSSSGDSRDNKNNEFGTGPAFSNDDARLGFDLVSMQFALHYMFENPTRLQDFFESWSNHLRKGCYFCVTTMDAQVVRKYLQDEASAEDDKIVLKDEQGRPTCTMAFDQATKDVLLKSDYWDRGDQSLGMRYQFTLTEYNAESGEGHNLVEAPEWIVSMDTLCQYANMYGNLRLVRDESVNFHDFYKTHSNVPRYRSLLQKMKVVTRDGGDQFSELEWKLAGLYRTAVFRKQDDDNDNERRHNSGSSNGLQEKNEGRG